MQIQFINLQRFNRRKPVFHWLDALLLLACGAALASIILSHWLT